MSTGSLRSHPNDADLDAFVDGELGGPVVGRVRAHLLQCPSCARRAEERASARDRARRSLEAGGSYPALPPQALEDRARALAQRVLVRGSQMRRRIRLYVASAAVVGMGAALLLAARTSDLAARETQWLYQEHAAWASGSPAAVGQPGEWERPRELMVRGIPVRHFRVWLEGRPVSVFEVRTRDEPRRVLPLRLALMMRRGARQPPVGWIDRPGREIIVVGSIAQHDMPALIRLVEREDQPEAFVIDPPAPRMAPRRPGPGLP